MTSSSITVLTISIFSTSTISVSCKYFSLPNQMTTYQEYHLKISKKNLERHTYRTLERKYTLEVKLREILTSNARDRFRQTIRYKYRSSYINMVNSISYSVIQLRIFYIKCIFNQNIYPNLLIRYPSINAQCLLVSAFLIIEEFFNRHSRKILTVSASQFVFQRSPQ